MQPSGAVGPPARLGRPAIAALGVLALTLGALQSVVEPALPLLQQELGIGPAEGALVANALLVTGAVATPVAGRLGDRYGGKRVLVRLMAVVVAGGLLASVAPGLPVLLLGQVLQGVMVGALPLSFILVRGHLPAGRSQVAIGLVVALFTGGGMVGTLVAGPIAEFLSWHAMFALPTLVIAVTTPVVSWLMPDDPPLRPDSRVDWPGMVLLSGTLLAFMLGLVTVTSGGLPPFAVGALALTVAGLATCWVAVERRTPSPMVDLRMPARPATAHAYLFTFLVTISSGMVLFLVPQLKARRFQESWVPNRRRPSPAVRRTLTPRRFRTRPQQIASRAQTEGLPELQDQRIAPYDPASRSYSDYRRSEWPGVARSGAEKFVT
ncbi:MFS transporter [Streptomyces sp. NPDC059631]|uniref:MFS transporter n=1 Tax=unclassified Streptomyces TaxID=2593676 RepID=UPI0036871161